MKPMFRFREGASVALKDDNPVLGLRAGDQGVVWALYDVRPRAYEVTFQTQEGEAFDVLIAEDELAASVAETPLNPITRALIGAHTRSR